MEVIIPSFQHSVVPSRADGLLLFRVISMEDVDFLRQTSKIRCKGEEPHVDNWRTPFWERLNDSIDAVVSKESYFSYATHAVLQMYISPQGIAHYTLEPSTRGLHYCSKLKKAAPNDHEVDGKKWYFHGEVPLQACNDKGNVLIQSTIWTVREEETCRLTSPVWLPI